MQRISVPSSVSIQPSSTESGTPGFFTNGDPYSGNGGQDATSVDAKFLNDTQEELVNIAEAAGDKLDAKKQDQCITSIKKLIESGSPDLSGYLKIEDAKKEFQEKGDYAPLSAGEPIGSIKAWPSYKPPEGWFNLDGGKFNKDTYPELFLILGTDTLQDWRGRFPRGPKGSWINVPEVGTYQGDTIRNISGSLTNIARRGGVSATGPFTWGEEYNINMYNNSSGAEGVGTISFDAFKSVPTDWENRPYSVISNFIIKAK